jgi:hypothetical protein
MIYPEQVGLLQDRRGVPAGAPEDPPAERAGTAHGVNRSSHEFGEPLVRY